MIRRALEVALAAMTPTLATAYENASFTPPAPSVAYQQAWLLLAPPANLEIGRAGLHRQDGFLQVDLRYPLSAGSAPAITRAELIRSTFFRGASFTASGVTVNISGTPEIMPSRTEADRFVVPVRIPFYAHIGG